MKISIRKKDLFIIESGGFSYSDFWLLNSNGGHDLDKKAFDVFIGRKQIATIIECNNGRYLISNEFSSFKSLDSATRGLLKRLNRKHWKMK